MALYCTVRGCTTSRSSEPNIQLFKLPNGAENDENWMQVLTYNKPLAWRPKKSTKICAKHFLPSDYTTNRGIEKFALPSRLPVVGDVVNVRMGKF